MRIALAEIYRVLKPHGRLVLSDPICEIPIPELLTNDQRLRALCLSGALPLQTYIDTITDLGFGTIEVRARRPYRILSPHQYRIDDVILIESVEICAIKDPVPADGPCVFSGRTAIYYAKDTFFDDKNGHILFPDQPLAVCNKTAAALTALAREDIYISDASCFYDGGGGC